MELTNIHPAEAYLRNEQNPSFLYIRIYGERRKLFINRGGENAIGIIAKGKRKRGYIFTDWDNIEKIYAPSQDNEKDSNLFWSFCGNSSVGRARPCQGRGRGSESRFPLILKKKNTINHEFIFAIF